MRGVHCRSAPIVNDTLESIATLVYPMDVTDNDAAPSRSVSLAGLQRERESGRFWLGSDGMRL